MKKMIGEYESSLYKFYNSLRKKYNLMSLDSLIDIDKILSNNKYDKLSIVVIGNDDLYVHDFIDELNYNGVYKAYGFFKDGEFAYNSLNQVRHNICNLLNQYESLFIYISVPKKSNFKINIPGTISIKLGKQNNLLFLDLLINYFNDVKIRMVQLEDYLPFKDILMCMNNEIKKYDNCNVVKFRKSEFYNMCNLNNEFRAIVAIKDSLLVGILIYKYSDSSINSIFEIKYIYVLESFRRRKIASEMFEYLSNNLRKLKVSNISISTSFNNSLYKKFILSLNSKLISMTYLIDV